MRANPPNWTALFKPLPCSDDEHWLRVWGGVAAWLIGLAGTLWYGANSDANWGFDFELSNNVLGAVFWSGCLVPLLLNTHWTNATRLLFLATFVLPWMLGLWLVLTLEGAQRGIVVILGFFGLGGAALKPAIHSAPTYWPYMFKPERCSDAEHWGRILLGFTIWLVGFVSTYWYASLRSTSPIFYPFATLFWLGCLLPILINTHRSWAHDARYLAAVTIPWLIGLCVIFTVLGDFRWLILFIAFIGSGLMTFVLVAPDQGDPAFIRGAECVTLADYRRRLVTHLRRTAADPDVIRAIETGDQSLSVTVAGAPLPPGNESLHTLVCASTGAGKSVTLVALLANIRARGERAIVLDNGHEFHRRFGRPDDVVMGPLANDHGWAIGNEIRQPYEWARFARSVVPDGHGESRSWHEYAQRFFANVGEALGAGVSNRELIEALTVWSPAELAPLLRGTTSAVMLQEGGERLLTNVRSIFSGYLQGWRYTPEGPFSFRDYMAKREDAAWLWIPYRESELGVARGLVTCWTDMLVTAGFDRTEGVPLTWIVIDELDSLGELSSLIEATTKLRKRRVAIVAAIQSLSQLTTHYGPDKARTLLNCFSNLLVLRSVEPDTAEALSRHLGEREHWDTSYSKGTSQRGFEEKTHSEGTNRTKRQSRIVLPSEIQALPDLHGFLKPAGPWPVVRVEAERPHG